MIAGSVMLASGTLRLLLATCILTNQVLLGKDRPNYQNGSARLRLALAGLALFFYYNGAELIWRAVTHPSPTPLWSGFLLSVGLLVVETLRLEKVLRSWLPSRLQRRIQQLLFIASCRNRDRLQRRRAVDMSAVYPSARPERVPSASVVAPALAELTLAGVDLSAPDESRAESFGAALREAFPLPTDSDVVIPPSLRDR